MMTVGIHDFSFTDLVKPEKVRLRKQLSGVINFALFREEKLQRGVEITQEVDSLAARKQDVEEEQERLITEKSQAEGARRQEAPEAQRIEEENRALATTVQEAFNQHTAVHEESTALKARLQTKKDELAATKFELLNAKEELEGLKMQIVPDPRKLTQDLHALQEAVVHEKENLRLVEAKGSDAARGLEVVERVEGEMEAVVEAQAEAEGEQRKLREVQTSIVEIGKRQESYKSKVFDQQLETKQVGGRRQVKEEALERLRAQRETRLTAADKKLAAEQGVLDGLHSERSHHAKQLEEHEVEIREVKDKLYKGTMDHNAETERVKQQQEQLAAQVHDYHKDLIKAMRQVSDQQAQQRVESAVPAVAAS